MTSPARASYQRKLASGSTPAAPAMEEAGAAASEYQLLLAALGIDLRQLSDIQSIERKIEAKRGMIARYLPWVHGALQAEEPRQDEIVATVLIWAIDLADWELALRLADHVLAHGIALPERYKRTPATLIAEEAAEAGLKVPPLIGHAVLVEVNRLTAGHDMHDQARAKLMKALGLALKAMADAFDPEAESAPAGGKPALIAAALEFLSRALDLDKASGVKKLIEGLTREQKKLAETEA